MRPARLPVPWVLLLSILCGLVLVSSVSCRDSSPEQKTTSGPNPDAAGLVGGVIVRDSATKQAIRDTADVALPANGGDSLDLIVTKSRYRLDIFREGKLLKTYPVALGDAPEGPKQTAGDARTPEGRYALVPHHPSPSFGGCFYVCYPNRDDADRGLAAGSIDRAQHTRIADSLTGGSRPPHDTALGGLILLHGTRTAPGSR